MPTITYTVDETAAVAHFAAQTAYGTPPSEAPTSSLLRAVEEIRPLAGILAKHKAGIEASFDASVDRAINTVVAGPASGAAGPVVVRALVADDIPTLPLAKLAALTVSRALVSNGAGVVTVSAVTAAELGFLAGVTSAIQTQLDAKQASDPTLAALALLATLGSPLQVIRTNAAGTAYEHADPPGGISGLTTGALPYASSGTTVADSPLVRAGANTIHQRNGTNVQGLYVYGTYTDADNYERFGFTFTEGVNAWDIRSDVAGTGTYRNLRFSGFVNADLSFRFASIGVYYPLSIRADFPPECWIRPAMVDATTPAMDLGGPENPFKSLYVQTSMQGGCVKALTSGDDIAFLRIGNAAADTLVGGYIRYTVSSRDSAGHAVEGESGKVYFTVRNQNGTVTATPDGTAVPADESRPIGSIGAVEFSTNVAGTNCDFAVNATTSLTPTGFDITFVPVITSGTAVVTSL